MDQNTTHEEFEHIVYGKRDTRPRVTVTYRVAGQQQTTSRSFSHEAYLRFVGDMAANGYEMLGAEMETR